MTRKFGWLLIGIVISTMAVWPATAQEKERVIILPFEIFSQNDLGDMSMQIKESLTASLAEQGATVIDLPDSISGTKTLPKRLIMHVNLVEPMALIMWCGAV